jgi:hypothetical protein
LGSFTFGIAASNSILLKKVELHYVTSVTTWNLEPPPGAAKTGKEFCSVVFFGSFGLLFF